MVWHTPHLKKGVRVMLTVNSHLIDQLVNGQLGTVDNIVFTESGILEIYLNGTGFFMELFSQGQKNCFLQGFIFENWVFPKFPRGLIFANSAFLKFSPVFIFAKHI